MLFEPQHPSPGKAARSYRFGPRFGCPKISAGALALSYAMHRTAPGVEPGPPATIRTGIEPVISALTGQRLSQSTNEPYGLYRIRTGHFYRDRVMCKPLH